MLPTAAALAKQAGNPLLVHLTRVISFLADHSFIRQTFKLAADYNNCSKEAPNTKSPCSSTPSSSQQLRVSQAWSEHFTRCLSSGTRWPPLSSSQHPFGTGSQGERRVQQPQRKREDQQQSSNRQQQRSPSTQWDGNDSYGEISRQHQQKEQRQQQQQQHNSSGAHGKGGGSLAGSQHSPHNAPWLTPTQQQQQQQQQPVAPPMPPIPDWCREMYAQPPLQSSNPTHENISRKGLQSAASTSKYATQLAQPNNVPRKSKTGDKSPDPWTPQMALATVTAYAKENHYHSVVLGCARQLVAKKAFPSLKPNDLAELAMACAQLQVFDRKLFEEMGREVKRWRNRDVKARAVARIAQAFADVRLRDKDVWAVLADKAAQQMQVWSASDLALLMCALARVHRELGLLYSLSPQMVERASDALACKVREMRESKEKERDDLGLLADTVVALSQLAAYKELAIHSAALPVLLAESSRLSANQVEAVAKAYRDAGMERQAAALREAAGAAAVAKSAAAAGDATAVPAPK